MDYDLRNRAGPMYPRMAPMPPPPSVSAGASYRVPSSSSASAAPPSSGLGIRVMIKPEYQITPPTPPGDPVVEKYVATGLARDAVAFAVLNYGDNPVKVREFVKGYNMIQEMGFTSKNVAEVLAMYDNDTDKALAHLLNN